MITLDRAKEYGTYLLAQEDQNKKIVGQTIQDTITYNDGTLIETVTIEYLAEILNSSKWRSKDENPELSKIYEASERFLMGPGSFKRVDEIIAANKADGKYFFSKATMRFFNSEVCNGVYGGRYFITSEQFDDGRGHRHPRTYTVRYTTDAGDCSTVGDFDKLDDFGEAKELAQALAAEFNVI